MNTPKSKHIRSQAQLVPLPMSPSSRVASSPVPKRLVSKPKESDGEELVKPRWSGRRKLLPKAADGNTQGQLSTRIPRVPRWKENSQGRGGARVVKPLIVSKPPTYSEVSSKSTALNTPKSKPSLPVSSISDVVGAKSPVFISSKAVPDLHNKILAKIKLNKKRSKQVRNASVRQQEPLKFDEMDNNGVTLMVSNQKDELVEERDMPVSGEDLEAYLASMFNMVDTYRTGLVRSSSLLDYLGSLVDLPRLDKWKLEELSRLLDPDKDDRYVDQKQWNKVGQTWIDMMLDPGNHVDKSSSNIEDSSVSDEVGRHVDEEVDFTCNVSYGSVEGVGGSNDSGCSSREVDLENRVSELSYQLVRLTEEKTELEKHLAGSEELAMNLAAELESSKKVVVNMSNSFQRADNENKEDERVKKVEEKCSLTETIEDLTKELRGKEIQLSEMEMTVVVLKEETEESKIREELMNKKLVEKFAKCSSLEVEIKEKAAELKMERAAKDIAENKLEVMQLKYSKLEGELLNKEEEIRHFTSNKIESVESGGSCSLVHDVSVDERVLMEQNTENHQVLEHVFETPTRTSKSSIVTTRGPSASSTPQKDRKGSIAEELLNMEACNDLPSPFCEKKEKESALKIDVLKAVDSLAENIRKILINQVKPGQSGRVMALFNREMAKLKKEIGTNLQSFDNPEEVHELRDKAYDLEEKLNEAKAKIECLESIRADLEVKKNIPEEIVKQVESKVDVLASMLHTTNSALLGATDVETPPDCSLDPDTDMSSWQLDLEGIQLMDSNSQMGKKLAMYTKWGKKSTIAEISCRSPIAITSRMGKPLPTEQKSAPSPATNSLLWQSLCKRLEDLQIVTEVSRDLLVMAGDSMKDQSVNQSNLVFPKTVSCQTTPPVQNTFVVDEAVQTSSELDLLHKSPSSTCLLENCFCDSSRTESPTIISVMVKTVIYLIFILLAFTFLCGFEIEHNLYYPVTWYFIRHALGEWVPSPAILVSYNTMASQVL